MDQLPLNPLLRGMYESELERQAKAEKAKKASLDEASHFKEMDEKAKEWRGKAKDHFDHADDHHKKSSHKHAGESRRHHEHRIARAHEKVASAFHDLADAYQGKEHHDEKVVVDMPALANPAAR